MQIGEEEPCNSPNKPSTAPWSVYGNLQAKSSPASGCRGNGSPQLRLHLLTMNATGTEAAKLAQIHGEESLDKDRPGDLLRGISLCA